ncbi:beta-ketoacyl synthase N-terminal-like domain-containing protein, partial [Desulfosporosinus nitroreducens]|uniref:beta-ketoacyl synthase N-terminal-like domain-containing protein n=1 Tax=Desulfosporosinus nitroreducens TaxID=2018668 RepID=UPI00207C276F
MELNNHWENTLVTSQKSFIELCELFPEKKFFTFQNGTEYPDFLTGKTLAQKTIILGSVLQQKLVSQEKALLLFTPGLEYIYSLMACLYANIVAIPIPVTDLTQKEQLVEIINNILIDSEATCIITDSNFKELLEMEQVFNSVFVLNVHEQTQDGFANQEARSHAHDDLALLLYTSGSSSLPKGVMLTHNNLISQAAIGAFQWKINKESCVVSWMPHFHNFGLFFGILSPLLQGATSVIQSPDSFVKDPVGWFKVIDQYKTTHTAAPNFAFDYCYSSVDISSVKEISLNSLQVIVCGGEPFSKVTYENFIEKFRGLGIDTNAFCPHYGMSEAGSITTKKTGQPIRFLSLDIRSMEQGKIKHTKQKHDSKSVTSCGEIEEFIKILCVNSETCEPCLPNEVGEIWIKSISVGRGYLKKEKETEYTFSGVLNNTKEGGFFRTGDLGFIEDNHLYIVGRDKDVIIIHGKNHHPVDIEWTIKKYVPYLTLPVSVFSREVNDQEKVVVVQEIEIPLNQTDYKKIAQDILTAVSENHMIELYEINLVKNGSIPRTGSGKIQRKICRDVYINQNIKIIYQYRYGNSESQSCIQGSYVREKCNILDDLIREVFLPELDIKFDRLSSISTFSELGLDSIQYMTISKRIEDVFKIQFTPVMLFKYRNFEKLAQYLSTELEELQIEVIQPTKMKNDIVVDFQDVKKRDIAIIGMDCNFPGGAENLELFWTNLINERDCITPISQSRPQILKDYQYYNGDLNDSFPQWGGFIGDVETFDASFFGISPMEAESMDPQQRKLLELTWRVIENSGYNPNQLGDMDIGLFVGVHNCDYSELVSRHTDAMNTYGAYLDSGLHMSMIANRTSRWFNFHGPSEVINSACSSSLVALHHAVESICRKESSLAIVAGINIILTSRIYRASHKAGMLSKDGRCKTFDQRSNGFVRAEGYGAVLLKPYNQAIKDGNTIYGVIKGAVINHDGQSNSLRAPNLNAQKQLIKSAYQESGISPETISYIETHGTGTSLGDPIEFQALQEAFEEINPKLPKAFCGLGSVKTNIGHCESAAGIAGLIKVLLAMKYQTLPRILHFENLNSYIPLKESPFYIVDQTHKWNRIKDSEGQEIARRAGISSFGYGGANAHVIVEEYIPSDTLQQAAVTESETEMMIVPLSAKNGERLRVYVKQLSEFLKKLKDQNAIHNSENVDLREIAYTLQVGREAMEERVVFLAREIPSLIQRLDEFEQGKEHIENSWQGRAKQGKDFVSLLRSDEETQKLVYLWLNKGMFNKIAQYWALGGTVNWDLLYDQNKPQCISLPTYPFARERYWIPEIKVQ